MEVILIALMINLVANKSVGKNFVENTLLSFIYFELYYPYVDYIIPLYGLSRIYVWKLFDISSLSWWLLYRRLLGELTSSFYDWTYVEWYYWTDVEWYYLLPNNEGLSNTANSFSSSFYYYCLSYWLYVKEKKSLYYYYCILLLLLLLFILFFVLLLYNLVLVFLFALV